MNIVLQGRKPVRFLVDAAGLTALIVGAGLILVFFGSGMAFPMVAMIVVALVMCVHNLANTISVPVMDDDSFRIRYGPFTRTIDPERVTSITYQSLTRTFTVRERHNLFGYRLAPVNFSDAAAMTRAIRRWAESNSVPIFG